jgi:hypothetical protein
MVLPECTVAVGKQETMRLLAKNPDYAHPMKEDVKEKSFSPPLGKMRVW